MKIRIISIMLSLVFICSCARSKNITIDKPNNFTRSKSITIDIPDKLETVNTVIAEETNNISFKTNLTNWENMPYNFESIYWSESYEKGNSTLGIRGSYLKWKGFKNKAFQEEVNLAILESIKSFQGYDERPSMHSIDSMRKEYISRSDSYLKDLCVNDIDFPDLHLSNHFSFSISLLTPDFISIIFYCYYQIGMAGCYETAFTINIDVKNEKIIRQPSALFSTSTYWDSLKPLFLERLKTLHPAIKSATIDAEWLTWESIWQYISFAFTPTNFLIIYNENETYSMDKRYIVPIPYNEVINLLNKDFVNLNQWQEAYSYFTANKDWSYFSFFDPNNQVFGYLVKYPKGCITNTDLEKGQIMIDIPSKQAKVTVQFTNKKPYEEQRYTDLIRFHGYSYEMTEFPDDGFTVLSSRERNVIIKIEYLATLTDDSILEINKILSTIRLY